MRFIVSNNVEKDLDEFVFDIIGDGFAYVLKLIDEKNLPTAFFLVSLGIHSLKEIIENSMIWIASKN